MLAWVDKEMPNRHALRPRGPSSGWRRGRLEMVITRGEERGCRGVCDIEKTSDAGADDSLPLVSAYVGADDSMPR